MWGWLKGDRKKAKGQVEKSVTRSDAEYLRLLNDLLDRLAVEPGYATLMAWSITQGVKEGELAVWLRGAAEHLDDNLRGRLELFVSLRRGDLWLVAEEVLGAAKTTVQGFSSDDAEEWFDRGNSLAMEGRFEEAIESYDQVISFKQDDCNVWLNRGICLNRLGRYEEAMESCDQVILFNHNSYETWFERGYSLYNLGRYEKAIKSWDQAISFKPNYYEALSNRGLALACLHNYKEAIESYDQAIFFKNSYCTAWYNRGISLACLGRYEEAIESYDQAISFEPNYFEAWSNRGISLNDLGRHEEAIKSYDQAISLNHTHPEAWSNKGLSLYDLGRYEEAIKSHENGLNHLKPTTYPKGWALLYRGLGQLHYLKGQNNFDKFRLNSCDYYRQALDAFKEAETTASEFPELHLNLIQDFIKVYSALHEIENSNNYREQGQELLK